MRLIHSMAAALLLFSAPVLSGAGVIWVEGEEARNTSFSPGVAPLSDGRAAGASGGSTAARRGHCTFCKVLSPFQGL